MQHWRELPNYSVIVDVRDRPDGQTTYVAEENIEIVSNTKVMHPQTDKHFESWDGAQYIARPWLKELYPHDQLNHCVTFFIKNKLNIFLYYGILRNLKQTTVDIFTYSSNIYINHLECLS